MEGLSSLWVGHPRDHVKRTLYCVNKRQFQKNPLLSLNLYLPLLFCAALGLKLTPPASEPRLASPLVLNWAINPFSLLLLLPFPTWLGQAPPCSPCCLRSLSLALPTGMDKPGHVLGDPNSSLGQHLKTQECKSSNNPQLLHSPLQLLRCQGMKHTEGGSSSPADLLLLAQLDPAPPAPAQLL